MVDALQAVGWPLIGLEFGLGLTAAALAPGVRGDRHRTGRSIAALTLVAVAAALPLGLRAWPLICFLAGLFGVLFVLRVTDLVRGGRMSLGERLMFVVIYFDIRGRRQVSPRLDLPRVISGLGWATVAMSGFWIAYVESAGQPAPWELGGRWLGGLLSVYATFEAVDRLLACLGLGLGWWLPPVQDDPIRSLSTSGPSSCRPGCGTCGR
jgi:hypothetical protein